MRLVLIATLAACTFRHGNPAAGGGSDSGMPGEGGGGSDARMADAPSDARRDAPIGTGCDPAACGQKTGTCMNGSCVITVTMSGVTPTCPDGMPCIVNCNDQSACKNTITCGNATSCTINCLMQNSCQGATMTCTRGCLVQCWADDTCWNTHYTCGMGSAGCTLECCSTLACGTGNSFSGSDTVNLTGQCSM